MTTAATGADGDGPPATGTMATGMALPASSATVAVDAVVMNAMMQQMAQTMAAVTAMVTAMTRPTTTAESGAATAREAMTSEGRMATATPGGGGTGPAAAAPATRFRVALAMGTNDAGMTGTQVPMLPPGTDTSGMRRRIKDINLPEYTPSPQASIHSWLERIAIMLRGAAIQSQGTWRDDELFFIVGGLLKGDAADWLVSVHRQLDDQAKTFTHLRQLLTQRYGERPNVTAAKARMYQTWWTAGQTFSDYAALLRRVVGNNPVTEQELVEQFINGIPDTVRPWVSTAEPKPRTVEEAAALASQIHDPTQNVARGMQLIGQQYVTGRSRGPMTVLGTMGEAQVIPGVGVVSPADFQADGGGAIQAAPNVATLGYGGGGSGEPNNAFALFNNPRGVWDPLAGRWQQPHGHRWNGIVWAPEAKKRGPSPPVHETSSGNFTTAGGNKRGRIALARDGHEGGATAMTKYGTPVMGGAPPPRTSDAEESVVCFACRKPGHFRSECPTGPKCYACNQFGHLASDCPDREAKARNDEYLRQRAGANRGHEAAGGPQQGNGRRA